MNEEEDMKGLKVERVSNVCGRKAKAHHLSRRRFNERKSHPFYHTTNYDYSFYTILSLFNNIIFIFVFSFKVALRKLSASFLFLPRGRRLRI